MTNEVTVVSKDHCPLSPAEVKRINEIVTFCENYNRECDKFFAEEARLRRVIGLKERRRIPVKYIFTKKCASSSDQNGMLPLETLTEQLTCNAKEIEKISISSSESSLSKSCQLDPEEIPVMNSSNQIKDSVRMPSPSDSLEGFLTEERLIQAEIEKLMEPNPEEEDANGYLDEELQEFRSIERDLRLTELSKSLLKIQRQIMVRKDDRDKKAEVSPMKLASHINQTETKHGNQKPSFQGNTFQNEPPPKPKRAFLSTPNSRAMNGDPKLESISNEQLQPTSVRSPNLQSNGSLTRRTPPNSCKEPVISRTLTPLTTNGAGNDYERLARNVRGYRSFRSNIPFFSPEQLRSPSIPSTNFIQHQHNNIHIINLSPNFNYNDNLSGRRSSSSSSSLIYARSGLSNHSHARESGLLTEMKSLGHDLSLILNTRLISLSCCTATGYLWKLSSKKKWKRRFFLFDRFHKVFYYYKSEEQFRKVKKPDGGATFNELKDVMIDRQRSRMPNHVLQQESPVKSSWLTLSFRRPKIKPGETSKSKSDEKVNRIAVKDDHRRFVINALQKPSQSPQFSRNSLWSSSMKRIKKKGLPPVVEAEQHHNVFLVEMKEKQLILSAESFPLMRLWIDIIFTGIENYFG